jgi:hypothetical protein
MMIMTMMTNNGGGEEDDNGNKNNNKPTVQIFYSVLHSQTPRHTMLCCFLNERDQDPQEYKTTGKIVVLHSLMFAFFRI